MQYFSDKILQSYIYPPMSWDCPFKEPTFVEQQYLKNSRKSEGTHIFKKIKYYVQV